MAGWTRTSGRLQNQTYSAARPQERRSARKFASATRKGQQNASANTRMVHLLLLLPPPPSSVVAAAVQKQKKEQAEALLANPRGASVELDGPIYDNCDIIGKVNRFIATSGVGITILINA